MIVGRIVMPLRLHVRYLIKAVFSVPIENPRWQAPVNQSGNPGLLRIDRDQKSFEQDFDPERQLGVLSVAPY